jgi:hypothetical protein
MKSIYIKTCIGTAALMLFLAACTDILEEQPRSIYAIHIRTSLLL